MSDVSGLNIGDEKSPGDEEQSIDWLEQLAREPDAIWGSDADETDSSTALDPEAMVPKGQIGGYPVGERTAKSESSGQSAQIKVQSHPDIHQAPTIRSSRPSREKVRSLVKALREAEESANAADLVEAVAEEQSASEKVLGAAEKAQGIVAGTEEEPHRAAQAEKSRGPAHHDLPGSGDELLLEMDDLMWLDDMDRTADMNMNPQEEEERRPAPQPGESDSSADATRPAADADYSMDTNADQVPDDPDEAIAWLERLAARQGALPEELPTLGPTTPGGSIEPGADDGFRLRDLDAGEIPEDPDEAMAWLEMLAAKELEHEVSPLRPPAESEADTPIDDEPQTVGQPTVESLSADLDEALGGSLPNGLDEALSWLEELTIEADEFEDVATPVEMLSVVEEPPTPAVAHHLDEALSGAELLFAEPERGEPSVALEQPVDELQYDEADDAMAWLEKLAARQGAPIEELTTMDNALEEQPEGDQVLEGPTPDGRVTADVEAVEAEAAAVESPASEVMEPLLERASVEAAEDLAAEFIDHGEDAALEEIVAAAEHSVVPEEAEERFAELELVVGTLEEPADIEVAAETELGEDLAWLDTLGAVDAEKWLAAEGDEPEEQISPSLETVAEADQPAAEIESLVEPVTLFGSFPEGPGSEVLGEARRAMEAGDFEESLTKYATLIEGGHFLAFLIDDLESISEQRGPEPGLQRVLGDAYARNGQLRKALESYREALANL